VDTKLTDNVPSSHKTSQQLFESYYATNAKYKKLTQTPVEQASVAAVAGRM